jgi:retron-type reverse transcriptase
MKSKFEKPYEDIISLENLFAAWQEFIAGKRQKRDVQQFSLRLTDNLVQLHNELADFTYNHGGYQAFNISDPKPRNIHKASVRDRVLHHAIYRQLYPFFDRTFIADSFSCRLDKGVHKAINRFTHFSLKASRNNTRTAWILKMDIKKFFASIDHEVLLKILSSYIADRQILWLLEKVISSFSIRPLPQSLPTPGEGGGVGLPLGNLTSQLFCNLYMNELDQFVKHRLKAKCYLRYADDFVLFSDNRLRLFSQISKISKFLEQRLRLSLHPDKVYMQTLASGVDFLGWVHFPHSRVLRTITQRRALKRIQEHPTDDTLQSYLGLANHGNAFSFKQRVLNWYGLLRERN